jgi:hypothetical protein
MTTVPLVLNKKKDIADGYVAIGRADDAGALVRSGAIDIDLDKIDGSECFKIELRGGLFQDLTKPLRKNKPAIIDLDPAALFGIVQQCRDAWQLAAIDYKTTVIAADGSQECHRPFEERWDEPVDSTTFQTLAAQLAVAGERLFSLVFESSKGTPLDDIAQRLREVACRGQSAFTVNAPDFHFPWGMLYTHPDPYTKLADDGSNFDKTGFWGYHHIIEQFTNEHRVIDCLTAVDGKLGFGAALHDLIDKLYNVPCLSRHRAFVDACASRLQYSEWTTKAEVGSALSTCPLKEKIVYFLCHGECSGTSARPSIQIATLEVTDAKIDATDVRKWIPGRLEGNQPLVFINACRAGQLSNLVFRNFTFATEFLKRGAACVVGPQIEVPAVFAGEYGHRFFDQFLSGKDPAPRVGSIIRDLNQFMWQRHNPLGLVYSLYAGADCHVAWT